MATASKVALNTELPKVAGLHETPELPELTKLKVVAGVAEGPRTREPVRVEAG
jgi:hypothetical protein